jgi:broad specificity phosphatase PhoE
MKRTLILVRHCQSDWNAVKRLSGQDNTARLTDQGRMQAYALANTLSHVESSKVIFSSDLTRTLETSAILSEILSAQILVDRRFREVGLGDLDGKTREEVHALPNGEQHLASLREDNYDFTAYRGENRDMVLLRHLKGIEGIFTRLEGRFGRIADSIDIIVVGHGSALRTLLNHYKPASKLHEQGGYDLVELPDA